MRHALGAEELLELGRASRRSAGRSPFFAGRSLGQGADDPLIVARVQMGETFADAMGMIGKTVQVDPKTMVATPAAARETVASMLGNAPSLTDYVLKVLVVAAVIVKDKIRVLGFEPQEVANFLVGASEAVEKLVPEAELPARLRAAEEDVVRRAPEGVRARVEDLIQGSGIEAGNLAPNIPEGTARTGVQTPAGLSALAKAALLAVPVVGAAVVALVSRR